jgi:hypothetical protein
VNFPKYFCSIVASLLFIGTTFAESKVVVEKDPITGRITMKSAPSGNATEVEQSQSTAPKAEPRPAITKKTSQASAAKADDLPLGKLGLVLACLGIFMSVVGGIWMLINMASVSILWLIGGLLLAPVTFFFLFAHWDKARGPLMWSLAGFLLCVAPPSLASRPA